MATASDSHSVTASDSHSVLLECAETVMWHVASEFSRVGAWGRVSRIVRSVRRARLVPVSHALAQTGSAGRNEVSWAERYVMTSMRVRIDACTAVRYRWQTGVISLNSSNAHLPYVPTR